MKSGDAETTLQELKELVIRFGAERGWHDKHHSPRASAIGIAVEAAELLEHYQWEFHAERDMEEVSDELSDVLFNLLDFAYHENIDISQAFRRKYAKLETKYPTSMFGKDGGDPAQYKRIKQQYRKRKAS